MPDGMLRAESRNTKTLVAEGFSAVARLDRVQPETRQCTDPAVDLATVKTLDRNEELRIR